MNITFVGRVIIFPFVFVFQVHGSHSSSFQEVGDDFFYKKRHNAIISRNLKNKWNQKGKKGCTINGQSNP